jgi:hypothetical protein
MAAYPSTRRQRPAWRLLVVAPLLLLNACVSANEIAKQIGRPPDQAMKLRAMETRRFDSADSTQVISTATQSMQDLGFIIAESSLDGGLVTGSKQRDATEAGQVAAQVAITVLLALGGVHYQPVWDKDQTIHVTLVAYPVGNGKQTDIRVTFDRIVLRSNGTRWAELIIQPEIYQGFFEKLSAGMALEASPI